MSSHRSDQVSETRQHLVEIPDLAAQLALFRDAGSTPADPDRRTSSSNPSRPPINLAVVDLTDERQKDADRKRTDYEADRLAGSRRRGILPTLSSWVLLVDEELEGTEGYRSPWIREACCAACFVPFVGASDVQGCCVGSLRPHPWEERTVAGECGYLLQHLAWCSQQQWFNELHDDVRIIRRDIRQAIGDRDPLPLQCTVAGCGWPVESQDDGSWYRCTGCAKTWSRLELHRLTQRQKPMKLREISQVLDVPVGTLKRWKVEGRISPLRVLAGVEHFSLDHCTRAKARIERGRPRAS